MFGDELKVKPGSPFTLSFDLQSVAGLEQVDLIGSGEVVKTQSFQPAVQQAHVDFPLTAQRSAWYSLIVKDHQGHKAYTDPIWVDPVSAPFGHE
jgi:LysM repeat protein